MNHTSEQSIKVNSKCYCQCYDMLAWNITFNADDSTNLMREKFYSCGKCKNGFSPDDNVIVHNVIHTLSLLNTFNIISKNVITKHHLTTQNIIHDKETLFPFQESTNILSNQYLSSQSLVESNHEQSSFNEVNNANLFAKDNFTSDKPTCRDEHFSPTISEMSEMCSSNDYSSSQGLEECDQESHLNNKNITESLTDDSQIGEYCCSLCSKTFKLQSHLTTHHLFHIKNKLRQNTKTLYCSLCNKRFSNRDNLSGHANSHYTKYTATSFSCNICLQFFPSKLQVLEHLSTHAKKKFCCVCNKSYHLKNGLVFYYCSHYRYTNNKVDSTINDMGRELRTHTGSCHKNSHISVPTEETNSKTYDQQTHYPLFTKKRSYLSVDQGTIHTEKNTPSNSNDQQTYFLSIQNNETSYSCSYNQETIHNEEKPHSNSNDQQTYLPIHTNNKLYSFTYVQGTIHTKEKTLFNSFVQQTPPPIHSNKKSYCKYDQETNHTDKKSFSCSVCQKTFKYKSHLKIHFHLLHATE